MRLFILDDNGRVVFNEGRGQGVWLVAVICGQTLLIAVGIVGLFLHLH